MCRSKENLLCVLAKRKGFSLPEVMAALMILALVSSSVLVVISRCTASAADLALRMQAFEIARDNMEKLLASDSVQEMVEYGSSEMYPDVQWQTVVEMFYEPVTSRMWIQAICSAEYTDTAGEAQTVELTHWLTDLTKKQLLQMAEGKREENRRLAEADQLIKTVEEAAEYAGIDEETVGQWVENGMPLTEDGEYVKLYLDLYQEYDGDPPIEAKNEAAETYEELTGHGPVWRRVPGTGPGVPQTPIIPKGPTDPEAPTDSSEPAGGPDCLSQLGPNSTWEEIMDCVNQVFSR